MILPRLMLCSLAFACLVHVAPANAAEHVLRVCADPNNLPYSNKKGEGFENKLAEMVAQEMNARVEYFWWAQRRGFLRSTLKADKCDLVMGIPADFEMLATTDPYYRSSYVFVSQASRHLDIHSMKDPRLADLHIGVDVIGDDGVNTPPAHALGRQGISDNVEGFMIYGDYEDPAPQARITRAVANGDIDIAAIWGPTAGYFAKASNVPLDVVPVTDTRDFAPLRFDFAISMGVRRADKRMQHELNGIISRRKSDIKKLLASYGVPMLPIDPEQTALRRPLTKGGDNEP